MTNKTPPAAMILARLQDPELPWTPVMMGSGPDYDFEIERCTEFPRLWKRSVRKRHADGTRETQIAVLIDAIPVQAADLEGWALRLSMPPAEDGEPDPQIRAHMRNYVEETISLTVFPR